MQGRRRPFANLTRSRGYTENPSIFGRYLHVVLLVFRLLDRVGIYFRVSTSGQTTENQRNELEAVATRSGWRSSGSARMPALAAPRGVTSGRVLTDS
jgi:hypothetical protein